MEAFAENYGRKLFSKHIAQYQPADPLYETYTDKKGKQRRRKRALPPGLSPQDQKILKSVQRRAHYLDKGFRVLGMRFGWTFIIGIVPGAGDIADAALNYVLVVRKAQEADIPGWLIQRMLLNNAISAGVGFIPILGDVVLATFKANSRNAALLEEYLRIRGDEFLKAQQERQAAVQAAMSHTEATKQPAQASRASSWWKGRKSKNGRGVQEEKAPPAPERGRFVEDVPGPVSP